MSNKGSIHSADPCSVVLVAPPRSGAGLIEVLWRTDPRWSKLPGSITWVPKNALRIHELIEENPAIKIIHAVRDPRTAVPSLVQAWRTGRFVSEPELAGWWGEKWSFPLIPNWRELIGRPLHQIAAAQWFTIDEGIRFALNHVSGIPVALVSYENLVAEPSLELERAAAEIGVSWKGELAETLPLSPLTVSPPNPQKWQQDIPETIAAFEACARQHRDFLDWAESVGLSSYREPIVLQRANPLAARISRSSAGTPFTSRHTASVPELLEKAAASVVISTYKSGHVIFARSRDGVVDTSFFNFDRPMGIAASGARLSIGTSQEIATFCNQPGISARLEVGDDTAEAAEGSCAESADDHPGQSRHDAVFLPRSVTYTGDVSIHEMGFDSHGTLWFVNTKFSCLCTQDLHHSFTVAWKPPWITRLAAEDRCHLNGLAFVDGQPRFVTALAQTDTPGGWRQHKGTSGVIWDLGTDTAVVGGLSMPHSPRWHNGKLWVLQSGIGSLSTVDVATGTVQEVARVPGFSRGLAFIGRYALVGLSQVRESVFAGLPITGTADQRNCGVWIVDTETGNTSGFLRFDGAVQEIFDVAVLPGVRWPSMVTDRDVTANSFILSNDDLQQVSAGLGAQQH